MKFSIYRYDPDQDAKPYMQEYELPEARVSQGMMLLDALLMLKEQDETLSFRRSCREGVCGSDGMNINGVNGLACITPLASLKRPVQIRPLPGLPVVRDLVGHGVGRDLHEEPQVPNYRPMERTPVLKPGMVLAIEPMVNAGTHLTQASADSWTVTTRDGRLSAHYEHTVAVTPEGPRILTGRSGDRGSKEE